MTADVAKTAEMLSPGPMLSKAGDFGVLVHSFIVVFCQLLSRRHQFELDVLNSGGERTRRRDFWLGPATVLNLLILPTNAAEEEAAISDPSIRCGAFFTVMAQQTAEPDDAEVFTTMSNTLLNEADGRLAGMGVALEERERIGGEAVTRASEEIKSNKLTLSFAACHTAMERGIEAAMPDVLSSEARQLLTCGSQFMYAQQTEEGEPNPDFATAAQDQLTRAQAEMEKAGITAEEQDQISGMFGLSAGMVLGMGEEPVIPWERCGEI